MCSPPGQGQPAGREQLLRTLRTQGQAWGDCARWCPSSPGPQTRFGVTVSAGILLFSLPCQQLNSALQGSDTKPTCTTQKGEAPIHDPGHCTLEKTIFIIIVIAGADTLGLFWVGPKRNFWDVCAQSQRLHLLRALGNVCS